MHHRTITYWLAKILFQINLIFGSPQILRLATLLGLLVSQFVLLITLNSFCCVVLAASLEQSINSNNTGSQLILTDEEELVLFGGQGTVFTSSDGKVDKKKTTLSEPTKSGKDWTPHKINPMFDILEAYIVSMRLLHVN